MGVPFAGLRGTGDFEATERPQDYRELILRLSPNGAAPLYALMSMMNNEEASDPLVNWYEETLDVPRVHCAAGLSIASTAATLDVGTISGARGNGLNLVVGDLLLVEQVLNTAYVQGSNEILRVAAVSNSTLITVDRGAAGTTAAATGTASFWTKIGNSFAEGSASPTVASRNPTLKTNFCQIFKTAYAVTGTALAVNNYRTGSPLKNDRIRKLFDHSAAIEEAIFFGRRSSITGANGKPQRTMGGLCDLPAGIGIPYTHLATSYTEDTLLTAFEPMFQNTMPGIPDERICFTGNGFLNKLNAVIKNSASTQIQFAGEIDVYGMNLQKIRFPYGIIAFRTHPLLNRNPRYTNSMFAICPPCLTLRPLRDTVEQKDIQGNDEDQKKNQFLTEISMEINQPSLMGHFHYSNT